MLTIYGIRQCDTCRKTLKYFSGAGVQHEFRDLRDEPVDESVIASWLKRTGPDGLINRRSTTWRNLNEEQRGRADDDTVALLMEHPTLIKRPVVAWNESLTVGYQPDLWPSD